MKPTHRITDFEGNVSQYIDRSHNPRESIGGESFGSSRSLRHAPGQDLTWDGTATESAQSGSTVYLVHMTWKNLLDENKSPTGLRDHLIFHTP